MGMFATIGGVQHWLEGNRAQRKRQRRALELQTNGSADSGGSTASVADPAHTAASPELGTAIKCNKALGADASLLEAKLLELRTTPRCHYQTAHP